MKNNNQFNLYRIKIKSMAPLLVGFVAPSHNLYDTLNYIPASTLRGALITHLLKEHCFHENQNLGKCYKCEKRDNCELSDFINKDFLSISDGIFLSNLNEHHNCDSPDLIPSHPLILRCKACSDENSKILNKLSEWIDNDYISAICQKCKRKTTMNSINKYYCRNNSCNSILREPTIKTTISTSINYATKSSLEGQLFQYNFIQSYSLFESYLFVRENGILNDLIANEDLFLWIGRGKSRGFGKIKLEFEKINIDEKIQRNIKIINYFLKSQKLIIAAKTPIFDFLISNKTNFSKILYDSYHLLKSFDSELLLNHPGNFSEFLSVPLIKLNEAIERVGKLLNINIILEPNTFLLEQTSGSLKKISGWALKTNQPKPHILASTPGTLYKYSVKKDLDDNIIKILSYLEFLGLNSYSKVGFNLIYFPSINDFNL
ncbi:MAG: RAMP superfamily CRISPR-associated protein [Candidatus Helarchaeota archaeon]